MPSGHLLQKPPRLVARGLIVVAITQTRRLAEMFGCRLPRAVFLRELPQLQMRSALHPLARFQGKGFVQVGPRLRRAAESSARGASLIPPQAFFAEHALAGICSKPCKAIGQVAIRVSGPARP